MNIKFAKLAFVIRELGIKASEILSDGDDGLEARVRIQKAVYFLKRLGFDFDYDFDLYYHGPYSQSLADDYYLLAGLGDEFISELALLCEKSGYCSNEMGEYIKYLNKQKTRILEVSATLIDLLEYDKDPNSAIKHLRSLKPWVNDEHIKEALKFLSDLGILKSLGV